MATSPDEDKKMPSPEADGFAQSADAVLPAVSASEVADATAHMQACAAETLSKPVFQLLFNSEYGGAQPYDPSAIYHHFMPIVRLSGVEQNFGQGGYNVDGYSPRNLHVYIERILTADNNRLLRDIIEQKLGQTVVMTEPTITMEAHGQEQAIFEVCLSDPASRFMVAVSRHHLLNERMRHAHDGLMELRRFEAADKGIAEGSPAWDQRDVLSIPPTWHFDAGDETRPALCIMPAMTDAATVYMDYQHRYLYLEGRNFVLRDYDTFHDTKISPDPHGRYIVDGKDFMRALIDHQLYLACSGRVVEASFEWGDFMYRRQDGRLFLTRYRPPRDGSETYSTRAEALAREAALLLHATYTGKAEPSGPIYTVRGIVDGVRRIAAVQQFTFEEKRALDAFLAGIVAKPPVMELAGIGITAEEIAAIYEGRVAKFQRLYGEAAQRDFDETLALLGERHAQEFKRRVEARELSPEPLDLNALDRLVGEGQPLTRVDMGKQALILTRAEFTQLGGITIRRNDGTVLELDPDDFSGGIFVLYPEELG